MRLIKAGSGINKIVEACRRFGLVDDVAGS